MSLLEAKSVSKNFAGISALTEVSIDVDSGELVGLIGPNGAGKTTFFNCLLGILRPDGGSVTFADKDLTRVPTHGRARLGIARTFQRIELFVGMSPREHFLVADRIRSGRGALWKDMIHRGNPTAEEQERAQVTLDLLGLSDVGDKVVESLSLGAGRLVEIGRALMTQPKLILLDEPSSGLDRAETAELAANLLTVHRETGVAILLVEHDVELVRTFVQRLYVLDFGTLIASGTTDDVLAQSAVRKAYLGDMV